MLLSYQHSCFIYSFDDPVPDGAVTYAEDVPFQYDEHTQTSLVIQQIMCSWLQVGTINFIKP